MAGDGGRGPVLAPAEPAPPFAAALPPGMVVPPLPDHLPLPVRQVYTPMITDAPGLNWVGPGDAWTRAWAQPGQASSSAPTAPAEPAAAQGRPEARPSAGSAFPPLPPLLDPQTAVAVLPLAGRARNTESDLELVRRSLAAVEPVADRAVAHFYAVLFVHSPELRSLFPAAMDLQRDRLFRALLAAARVADDPVALTELVEPLARGHRKYGVRDEHYPRSGRRCWPRWRSSAGPPGTGTPRRPGAGSMPRSRS
ncbi:hypothetical protein GXW82_32785 [Streptacidiphilus sp. 4-A2]|nr:hypothetical protein [Streptacidiphilus sp. 4-A2]